MLADEQILYVILIQILALTGVTNCFPSRNKHEGLTLEHLSFICQKGNVCICVRWWWGGGHVTVPTMRLRVSGSPAAAPPRAAAGSLIQTESLCEAE